MEDAVSNKRCRDDSAEWPEAKRLREADLLLEILDDDDADAGDRDLADVMKSFEEEIGLMSTPVEAEIGGSPQPDLGYLLEASDDELGLPPTVGSCTSSSDVGDVIDIVDDEPEKAGFGQIWGFEDEILGPYEGLEFGIPQEERGVVGDEGIFFDGGLFDCLPADYEDLSWRTDYLPAV